MRLDTVAPRITRRFLVSLRRFYRRTFCAIYSSKRAAEGRAKGARARVFLSRTSSGGPHARTFAELNGMNFSPATVVVCEKTEKFHLSP